jgi:hypothetical protein
MAKKNSNTTHANEIRDSLDSLINDNDIELNDDQNLPSINNRIRHNYVDIKDKSIIKAKKTLKSMLKFYLSEDIIENEEYIEASLKLKEMELTQLIYLMETGERAITTLLGQIDGGELSPRMFEVLATLQKSQLDMIKSQTLYMMAAEEATKKQARDLEIYNMNSTTQKNVKKSKDDDDEDKTVFRGTKGLMNSIQSDLKHDSIIELNEYGEAGKSGYDGDIIESSKNAFNDDIEE